MQLKGMQTFSYLVSFTCHRSSSLLQDLGSTSSMDEDLVAVMESKTHLFTISCLLVINVALKYVLCAFILRGRP